MQVYHVTSNDRDIQRDVVILDPLQLTKSMVYEPTGNEADACGLLHCITVGPDSSIFMTIRDLKAPARA